MHKECQNIRIILLSQGKAVHPARRSGCFPRWYAVQLYVISLGCRSFGGLQRRWLQPLASKPENIPLQPFLTGMLVSGHRRGSSVHAKTAASRFLPHHHDCGVKFNGFSFTRWPRCGFVRAEQERNPRRAKGNVRENHPKRPFRHRLPECFQLIRNVHIPRRNVVVRG